MYVSSGLHWLGYWELALGALQSHVVFPHTGLVMGFWVFVLPPVVVLLKMKLGARCSCDAKHKAPI